MRRGLHDAGLHRTPRRSTTATLRLRDYDSPCAHYGAAMRTGHTAVLACATCDRPTWGGLTDGLGERSSCTGDLLRWMANHPHANLATQRIRPACSQPAASPPPNSWPGRLLPPRFRCRRRDPAARARAPLSPAWIHPSWGCSTHERSATSSPHLIHSCTTTSSPTRHTLSPYPSRELWARLHNTT